MPTLRRYPVGALLGIVLTGALTLATHALPGRPWLEVPITLMSLAGCMLVERLIDWRFSGRVDARMVHSAAHEEARLAFAKLEDYESRGIINKVDAHKIAARIAKRDVAGGPRHAKPRGPYKKGAATAPPPSS